MRWCFLASLLVLAEAAWEFGLDSPDLELIGATKGKIKAFQKITRVEIPAPQCYEINYVLVEVNNMISNPDVSYNKNTQIVTIKYKLLQASYSSYYITVKGRRKQVCETLYPGGIVNPYGDPLNQNILNIPLQNDVYQNGGLVSLRGRATAEPKHNPGKYNDKKTKIRNAMHNSIFPYFPGSGILKDKRKPSKYKKRPKGTDLQPFKIFDTINKRIKPPSKKRPNGRVFPKITEEFPEDAFYPPINRGDLVLPPKPRKKPKEDNRPPKKRRPRDRVHPTKSWNIETDNET